ncbi:hypothetical protein PHMEG_00025279 [Phytophthora megakarya]|uniref:SWIM-type domain-containing protein n=1 Tax=Phytophthora megakarya TaxID=4795 RepID=A0A225VDN1_9STRA|nr:hypothetical protein PHMEG_00025279 [Phytophthora megakarya]
MTPVSMKIYDKQSKHIGQYHVEPSSTDVYYQSAQKVKRGVALSQHHCTCGFMDQMRIPFRHLICVLDKTDSLDSVFTYFDRCYMVGTYAEAFRGISVNLPLENELGDPDTSTQPAPGKKGRERPSTKRIRINVEAASSATYACTRCKQNGHNIRTCQESPK